MTIKLIPVKCPECNANLQIEENRRQAFCTYCGAKILIQNENEYYFHNIDEAEVKQAETDRMVQIKKLELLEKLRQAKEKSKKRKIIFSIILGLIGIFMMILGSFAGEATGNPDSSYYMIEIIGFFPLFGIMFIWLNNNEDDEIDLEGKKKLPSIVYDCENKNYKGVYEIICGAGFTNVTCVPLKDLRAGLLIKPETIESITVNGEEPENQSKKYLPTAKIVITYHSLMR